MWSSYEQITLFFPGVSSKSLEDMLLHKYSIKKYAQSSNSFHYRPVCAMSSLSLSRSLYAGTQQRWLTVVKLFGGGVDRKMATLGSMCMPEMEADSISHRKLLLGHSVCWFNVCECVPMHVCWPPRVFFNICVAHEDSRPNWLSCCCFDDSHYGTMWSRAVTDTSQVSFIDESLI